MQVSKTVSATAGCNAALQEQSQQLLVNIIHNKKN
jgi:hypothetical protein